MLRLSLLHKVLESLHESQEISSCCWHKYEYDVGRKWNWNKYWDWNNNKEM
jgi:hypothetical protein